MMILFLLLSLPTCSDTWWSGVDVIFGLSRGSVPYHRPGGWEGEGKQGEPALAVLLGVADTMTVVGRVFEYRIRKNAFLGNVSHLTVTEAGRIDLPAWMFFNRSTNTFLGLPTALDEGSTVVEVTAHANNQHVTAPFVIDVKPANQLHPAWLHDTAAQPLKLFQDGDPGRRNDVICAWDETVIYTTLIVDTEVQRLSADQRVKVLRQFAHYLSRDMRSITFAPVKKHDTKHGFLYTRVLAAGPGNVGVKGRRTAGAELFWISGCGEFSHSADVAMVMERNIRSGKVTESIGLDVIGWYVWDNRPAARRFKRQIRGTPIATPSVGTPKPTRVPSRTTITDSTTSQTQPSSESSESPKTVASSSAAYIMSTLAALPSSSIAVTPSFVSPRSSKMSPMVTSVAVSTTVLLSTLTPELSALYTSTSAPVTTSLSIATTPLTITTMPLAIVTTPLAIATTPLTIATTPMTIAPTRLTGSSTAVPGMSENSLQIMPTKSSEVMTPSVTSLAGHSAREPARPSASILSEQISATMTVSSSLTEEATVVQDTLSPLLLPSSTFYSSTSIDETLPISISPSLAFKPNSTYLSVLVPNSLSPLHSVPDFMSAYSEPSSGVIWSDLTVVPSRVITVMPSTQTTLGTTDALATPSADVWTRAIASSLPGGSPSSVESRSMHSELMSIADTAAMTPTVGSVSMATSTRLPTPGVTAAATSDLYSLTTSLVLLPPMTSLLATESASLVITHSQAVTVSQGAPLSTLVYSSVIPHSSLPSDVVTPISLLSSSVEVFGSTTTVFETATGAPESTTMLIEHSTVETSPPRPAVSTVPAGASKGETTIYASTTISPSVSFETFPSSTGLHPVFPSTTSLTIAPFLTTLPLPSSRVMAVTETATLTSSMTSVGTLTSMLPLETSSSLIVSSLTSHALTTSVMLGVTSSVTEVTSRVTEVTSTAAAPQRPRLVNRIHKIMVRLGTYFEFPVPAETFYDPLDGDTMRLSLHLISINNLSLPSDSWVQLDTGRQVVYGLPLANDVTELPSEYVLVASNSLGLTTSGAIQIIIDLTILDDISHRFFVNFRLNYTDFMRAPMENLKVIVKKLGMYYDDASSVDNYDNNHVSITDLTEGSVQMSWTNNSVSKTSCENETIEGLYARMSHNGSVSDRFQQFMLPQAPVVDVKLHLLGVCRGNGSSPEGGMGRDGVASTGGSIWLVTIIPALVVIALVVIIILIVVVRNKRRLQRGRYLPDSEKTIFGKNRKPVLMPEEMEMLDLGLRPKKPVTMPTDNQHIYTNAAYEHDPLPPPPYQQPGSLPRQVVSPPVYDIAGVHSDPPPKYRLPPPYVANTNNTVLL